MCVQAGNRQRAHRLKTGTLQLGKENWELALRLFEYQDFIEAPFMQDADQTVYEGLKGRNGRNNC